MSFVLTVSKGPGQGTDFEFDQPEARLGRTADNDIVVKDASASRSHCRVFVKNGKFFLEDLKSANGTKLNANWLTGSKEMKAGDTITIGDVVFTFKVPKNDSTMLQPAAPMMESGDSGEIENEDPNSTLLKPARASKSNHKPPERSDTEAEVGTVPRGKKLDVEADDNVANMSSTREVEMPPPRALAKITDETRDISPKQLDKVRAARESGAMKKAEKPAEVAVSAADKARARREMQKSTMGRVGVAFLDLSPGARIFTGIVVSLFAVGVVASAAYVLWPKPQGPKKIEPHELVPNAPAVRDTFGAGEDVEWSTPDQKIFTFALNSPTKVVAVLHYMARDISKDEVSINCNGTDLGFIPPDTLDVRGRELEVVLPPTVVKTKGEPNTLVFDSLFNPPKDDPWKIWNMWLELLPVPEMGPEETARAAKEDIEKAEKAYEMRDVGAENLFRSWKTFREAWLLLESMPDRPQDLYNRARSRMREIRPELDKQCNGLLVEVQKAMNVKPPQRRKAVGMLKDIERFFPTREHPCYGFSREMLNDMGEW